MTCKQVKKRESINQLQACPSLHRLSLFWRGYRKTPDPQNSENPNPHTITKYMTTNKLRKTNCTLKDKKDNGPIPQKKE